MSGEEVERTELVTAASQRGLPLRWGVAPEDVEKRRAWIAERIREDEERRRKGEPVGRR